MGDLALDSALRGWVFIPLTACIVLMKLLQQYAHMMMNGAPPKSNKTASELKEVAAVARSQRLRQFGRVIPEQGFKMRKEYFAHKVGLSSKHSMRAAMQIPCLLASFTATAAQLYTGHGAFPSEDPVQEHAGGDGNRPFHDG